jgi:hypothetical protein
VAGATSTPGGSGATGALSRFPLDLGFPHHNGDDRSPVRVHARPATRAFDLCGRRVWDPRAGTTDVIGVEFRGEGEWARGRTLVLFPTERAAIEAVTAGREAMARCPEEPADGSGDATAHTLLDIPLGDESVVWIDRFLSADTGGHVDTGLVVYEIVRVGRAVLMSYDYGEGNGTDDSRDRSVTEATEADRLVVDRMRRLASALGRAA